VTSNVAAGYVKLYSADGSQAASATYTVSNRVSGTNASGVYNVALTLPQSLAPGSYLLGIQAQNAVSSPSKVDSYGWDQMTALGLPATLTLQNSKYAYYQLMIDSGLAGAAAALTGDPEADGVKNLAEFAFGMNPAASDSGPLVVNGGTLVKKGLPITFVVGTGSQQRLRIEFVRRLADPGQQAPTYQVEFSDDVRTWTPAVNAAVVVASAGSYEVVSVDDQTTGAVRSKRFAHVVITY